MSLPTLAEYRARGIILPADDTTAQDVIDGEEAWLARQLGGALEGDRTETFHVGYSQTVGKLGLARYTDAVAVVDAGATVPTDQYRLVDRGSGIERIEPFLSWWTGPYVTVTYAPNDGADLRRALFDLVALAASPISGATGGSGALASETIGAYSYSVGGGGGGSGVRSLSGSRAVIVSSIEPVRDPLVNLYAVSRRLHSEDPVINRAELPL